MTHLPIVFEGAKGMLNDRTASTRLLGIELKALSIAFSHDVVFHWPDKHEQRLSMLIEKASASAFEFSLIQIGLKKILVLSGQGSNACPCSVHGLFFSVRPRRFCVDADSPASRISRATRFTLTFCPFLRNWAATRGEP